MGRRGHGGLARWTAVLAASLLAAGPVSGATPGTVFLGASLGQKSLDILSEGDARPNARPFAFAEIEAQYFFSDRWAVWWSGQLGGSFFDFNGSGTSGKVEEVNLSSRVGAEWIHGAGAGSFAFAGLGYEYGEARSWLENLQVNEIGPKNVLNGVFARAGAAIRVAPRLLVTGELQAGAYRGRADVGPLTTRYHWLGRSLGVSVGLRYVVRRGTSLGRPESGQPGSQ